MRYKLNNNDIDRGVTPDSDLLVRRDPILGRQGEVRSTRNHISSRVEISPEQLESNQNLLKSFEGFRNLVEMGDGEAMAFLGVHTQIEWGAILDNKQLLDENQVGLISILNLINDRLIRGFRGNLPKIREVMRGPIPEYGNKSPLQLLYEEDGAFEVMKYLGREHGIKSYPPTR